MKGSYHILLSLIILATVLITHNTTAQEINEGLVLYLPFDEGTKPIDHADDPTEITINGALKPVPGKFGEALDFPGKAGNMVEVTHSNKLEGMDALTIAAWIQPRDPAGQEGMSIASKRNAHQQGDVFNFFIWEGQKIHARINSQGQLVSNTVFEDGRWYHVAYVFNPNAGGTDQAQIYVNGELDISAAHPEKAVGEGGATLWIGELDANRGFFWNGLMDDVAIWSRALSKEEIQSVADDGLQQLLPVEPTGKLTTTWSQIKVQR